MKQPAELVVRGVRWTFEKPHPFDMAVIIQPADWQFGVLGVVSSVRCKGVKMVFYMRTEKRKIDRHMLRITIFSCARHNESFATMF